MHHRGLFSLPSQQLDSLKMLQSLNRVSRQQSNDSPLHIDSFAPLRMQSSLVIALIPLRDTSRHRRGSHRWWSSNEAASLLDPNIFSAKKLQISHQESEWQSSSAPACFDSLKSCRVINRVLSSHVIGCHTLLLLLSSSDLIKWRCPFIAVVTEHYSVSRAG